MKTSCKLALQSDVDSSQEGASAGGFILFDPATTEILLDLGRAIYKLMFQLLLLIESNHKIAMSVVNNLKQNEKVKFWLDKLRHGYNMKLLQSIKRNQVTRKWIFFQVDVANFAIKFDFASVISEYIKPDANHIFISRSFRTCLMRT